MGGECMCGRMDPDTLENGLKVLAMEREVFTGEMEELTLVNGLEEK